MESRNIKFKVRCFKKCFRIKEICTENQIKISKYTTILGILRYYVKFSSLVDLTNTNSDNILLDQNLNLNKSTNNSESNTFPELMESRKIKSKPGGPDQYQLRPHTSSIKPEPQYKRKQFRKIKEICTENQIKISKYTTILGALRHSVKFSSLLDLINTNSDHIFLDQNLNLGTGANSSESNTFPEEMKSRNIKSKVSSFKECFRIKE
ncbi:hypothetical protein WA026_010087 [Henosepilachna vigintioctopunctata]|uniref:Uncharacterized protein n=1 Tax=Henosepilachna vigintioctopunctata TaxID=420089 RepID=A0AAW1U8X5_9CUCU